MYHGKKDSEIHYFVTNSVSVPVVRVYGKTEMYCHAVENGWGTVYRGKCNANNSFILYTKDGGYYGIFPGDDIIKKEIPKQAACAAIICTDSGGYSFWAEIPGAIEYQSKQETDKLAQESGEIWTDNEQRKQLS